MQAKEVTLCGSLFSNPGNGVKPGVVRWNDTGHDVLATVNTKDRTAGNCGAAEFVLPPVSDMNREEASYSRGTAATRRVAQ